MYEEVTIPGEGGGKAWLWYTDDTALRDTGNLLNEKRIGGLGYPFCIGRGLT